jgi:hypothetical protein
VFYLGVVEPKHAIELGQNTRILCYTAKSNNILTPTKLIYQHKLGLFYPDCESKAAI